MHSSPDPAAPDLSRVPTADLETLAAALAAGRLREPFDGAAVAAAGLSVDSEATSALGGLPAAAALLIVRAVLAERRRAGTEVQLVWTGPEPAHATTRDTRRALEHLFRGAQRSVLLAGFSFDHGEELFEPMQEAMRERGVSCDFFVDVPGDQLGAAPEQEEPQVRKYVATFLERNWPWTLRPVFHYDPRRFRPDVFASVHAKCVVVDDARAFVTSANFTDRGQTRNIEVGVLVDDGHFASNLAGQFRRCARQQVFRRVPTDWLPGVTTVEAS